MEETREDSYSSEMNEGIETITESIAKSIVTSSYAYRLLDLVIPYRFLGITGQMRRNTCALQLGADIVNELITVDEAIEKLRMFDEDFFSENETSEMNEMAEGYAEFAGEVEFCPCCGTAIGIKGGWVQEWEQLSLWSQSELDQI